MPCHFNFSHELPLGIISTFLKNLIQILIIDNVIPLPTHPRDFYPFIIRYLLSVALVKEFQTGSS